MTELLALIAGKRVGASDGRVLPVINPATGQQIGVIPRCTPEDADRAVEAASTAFSTWRKTDPGTRAACVLRFAEAVERDAERLLELEVSDNGSPRSELRVDIRVGIDHLRYFAGLTYQLRGETIPTAHDRLNFTRREPFGVVARVLPFNHPIMFALSRLAAPLLAGNTLIIKPSEHTSLSTLALADQLSDCFPEGVVSVVPGLGAEVGDALITHPKVRRIAFIGSLTTGLAIQARAATSSVKHVSLELGGKSPLVVFPDSDKDAALDAAVAGLRTNFQGQACGATTRLFVHQSWYSEFTSELAQRLGALRVGDPNDPTTQVGATVNLAQLEKVLGFVDAGRAEGATVLVGGDRLQEGEMGNGYFMAPTLLSDVDPRSPVAQQEIFGPVLVASPFNDYDEAVALSNDVSFGLTAGVFTGNLETALSYARDVEAGYVWVNENQRHFPGTPYGGVKDSGLGREEDFSELESYTQIKNVHIAFDSRSNHR